MTRPRQSSRLLLAGIWVVVALATLHLQETSGQASWRFQACSKICEKDMPQNQGILRNEKMGAGEDQVQSEDPQGVVRGGEGTLELDPNDNGISGDTGGGGVDGRFFPSHNIGKKNSSTVQITQGSHGEYYGEDGKKVIVVQKSQSVQQSKHESQTIRWFGKKRRRRSADGEKGAPMYPW